MTWWPFRRRRLETRASYTSSLVSAFEQAAAGTGGEAATGAAAVEVAAGAMGRALSLATVEPRSGRTAAITRSFLALVGRELARHGELVSDIEVRGGRVFLTPAAWSSVTVGGPDPSTWVYTLTLNGPADTRTVYRPRASVCHLQANVSPARPWQGRAPWQSCPLSGELLAGIEKQLSGEAGGPSGYVMSAPDTGGDRAASGADDDGEADPLTTLRQDMAGAKGSTLLVPTMRAGFGGGPGTAPDRDYLAARFGMNPPQAVGEPRRDVGRDILAASGFPPILASHNAPGTSLREAWRQFVALTVEPVAELVAEQLSEAMDVRITLDMRRTRAADVVMLARAWRSLAGQEAKLELDQAREVVGL